ncbi:MAG TPA: hypothetical protein VFS15_05040 [Kofleriaceae bacterium]|nr:hypothetical protein [Kofleriaceae bacterium]
MLSRPRLLIPIALVACSSASPAPERPATEPPAPADAAVDAPIPDAGPSAALLDAPAWIFRYTTKDRAETWTLRVAGDEALLEVATARGVTRYLGSASDTTSLVVDVTTGTAKLRLDCKHAKRPLGTKCNDTKAAPVEVLDCYHPDFTTPMPFGREPGIEYAVDSTCNGYRLVH